MVQTERMRLVRYLLYLYCVSEGFTGTISIHGNGFKFLKQVKSKTNQFEIVFKSLARFSTQFRVKKSFKLLFVIII